ncbi:unnamed protein product [Symbiodinium necroappetens]|uniref:Beta-lactamase-related domain-containing protein n=1 Tax=Symbiodinium necroappetens TaxID=1628268 RepID=A0A812KKA9_9DINO|nr:unnamed protein product [Symbiodinium necroappetens]|mmetsp:Transcript_96080/g.228823  ORF Transcript_96080/g.228823 Transcript_96080/m.228823 type:complete len:405 (-) Transcript_96080:120-1334(-)|eukprot:CAMPEP_0181412720 /NCGR_PEP_ID=MMETSP1110-20121109/8578_1 /TAXON_ID=174948 /ORGANISM="Symbiodinium sp., Strain CCMP421" /LENGTH=404 /DNA_ID=CAMNT_0023535463 /DNA_START=45 /DNA_END=1259 /DNA_ORIENTATION=+
MTGAEAAPALSLPRVESAVKSASNSVGRCGGVVLQAAAASNQSLLFAAAAGGLENGAEKISLRDAFEVASVTKIVTATAVMQLADEGLLHLDQDLDEVAEGRVSVLIQEKVPKWPLNRLRGVTITQLLQHTSGLPNYWNGPFVKTFEADPDKAWSTWELLGYAADMKESCPLSNRGLPGSFDYADTNYLLLGLVLEALTTSKLPEIFRARVFDPAGMSRTGTYCSFLEHSPQGAPPMAKRYVGHTQITGKMQHSADSFAAGGIVSTTSDLQKLMAALACGDLFPIGGKATLERMMSWIPAKRGAGFYYGLGLMRVDLDAQKGIFKRCLSKGKPRGFIWGHEGFGGAFSWCWVPGDSRPDVIISGSTNNEGRSYGVLIEQLVDDLEPHLATLNLEGRLESPVVST